MVAGPALLFLALRHAKTLVWAVASGLAFGIVFMAVLMGFLVNLGWEAPVGLVVSQAPFYAAMGGAVWIMRANRDWKWVMFATGLWTAMEFTRARVPFGGLEWGAVGYPAGELAALRGAAQWIGTSGWGVLFIAVAAALAVVRHDRRPLFAVGGLAVLVAAAGSFAMRGPTGEALQVAIVQGNSPCPIDHCAGERAEIFQRHLDLTAQLQPGSVDLVLWPESATTFPVGGDSADRELVLAEAARLGAVIVVGGDRPSGSASTFINSNVTISADGRVIGEYRKQHPVPFGEYVPVRSLFGRLGVTDRVPRDMVRGDGPEVVTVDGYRLGGVISFEGAFARYPRSAVAAGAQLLVVASNEASYGLSSASAQFIGMTRMRAAETGVDVLHGAVTGASTLITSGGDVGPRTDLYSEGIVRGEARARNSAPTLFVRWGDWLAVAAMTAGAIVAMWVAMIAGARRPVRSFATREAG